MNCERSLSNDSVSCCYSGSTQMNGICVKSLASFRMRSMESLLFVLSVASGNVAVHNGHSDFVRVCANTKKAAASDRLLVVKPQLLTEASQPVRTDIPSARHAASAVVGIGVGFGHDRIAAHPYSGLVAVIASP